MPASTSRTATVKVNRPVHVPRELHAVWHGAAVRLARQNRLVNDRGQVDYEGINEVYSKILASYQHLADRESGNDRTAAVTGQAVAQPRENQSRVASGNRRVAGNAWPFSDITPNDIAKMAASGQWQQVAKAARMASQYHTQRRPVQQAAS